MQKIEFIDKILGLKIDVEKIYAIHGRVQDEFSEESDCAGKKLLCYENNRVMIDILGDYIIGLKKEIARLLEEVEADE